MTLPAMTLYKEPGKYAAIACACRTFGTFLFEIGLYLWEERFVIMYRIVIALHQQIRWIAGWVFLFGCSLAWAGAAAAQSQPAQTGLSVQQAAAYVETVFAEEQEDVYASAADIYLLLLGVAGDSLDAAEQAIVHRQVARMILMLPEDVARQVADGKVRTLEGRLREHWTLKPGAGAVLTAWWRAQDSLPGTTHHERLEEHLRRIAFADRHYASPYSLSGWDDRGLIYLLDRNRGLEVLEMTGR